MKRVGFTLLEILIATSIFMTAMVFAVAIFSSTTGSASTSEELRLTSQTTRLIFEAMTREIRLAKGLVIVKSDTTQQLLIPPFEVVAPVGASPEVRIYQVVKNSAGNYDLTKKIYQLDTKLHQLTLTNQADPDVPLATLQTQLNNSSAVCDANAASDDPPSCSPLDNLSWGAAAQGQPTTPQSLIPKDLQIDKFSIIHSHNYPTFYASLDDTFRIQPFIQLELSVLNPRYNVARRDNTKIRITLRSMIVPRNFVAPYQVVQPGLQGLQQ